MDHDVANDPERKALRDRLSLMSAASLRINVSLDFDTVLRAVADSARELTDSRYAVIATLHGSDNSPDFVTSGITSEERRALEHFVSGGPAPFRFLSALEGPLRVGDFQSLLASRGIPDPFPVSVSSYMVAPVKHLGESIANLSVARDEHGGEFSREDEETLAMFASQAALAIANARRYQDERRARADLETRIESSPVGACVFDANTRALVSFNREAARIVDYLRDPEQPATDLLEVVTLVRADGRVVSLEEFAMTDALSTGETGRAEEFELRVPDGRSVTVMANATPVQSANGGIEKLVVTLQDLTPIKELDRLRADFLATVTHDLRTPLMSMKGSVATLLDPPDALSPTEMRFLFTVMNGQIDRMHTVIADLSDVARIEKGELEITPVPTDVAALMEEAGITSRSGRGLHRIDLSLEGDLPQVMADRSRLVQVLSKLLSSAAQNSPITSPIRVSVARRDVHVAVTVADEGPGVAAEDLPTLFQTFSRAGAHNGTGDTGLGLAICKGIVEAHGGRIWAETDGPGRGPRITFTIPTVDESGSVSPVTALPTTGSLPEAMADQVLVLALDDDPQARRHIWDALTRSGFKPIVTDSPATALRLLAEEQPDLVLQAVTLPETDGVQLMQEIRARVEVPVIVLAVDGQDDLVARAFDVGAADYLVKPFSAVELLTRIRAALRRTHERKWTRTFVLGDLTIDYMERHVSMAGRSVRLTNSEYAILAELSMHAGRVLTYDQLSKRLWNTPRISGRDTMRAMVKTLRRKLGDSARKPSYIFTEFRVGYRMPQGETREPPVA